MGQPWNNWYHCTGNTYGTWVRGDQRGWRARHHREHCEGDYRHPPPEGEHAEKLRRSKRLMQREPVVLDWPLRVVACHALVEALLHHGAEVVSAAVTAKHFHVLVRFQKVPATGVAGLSGVAGLCGAHHLKDGRDPVPRYVMGKAKSWSSRAARKHVQAQSPGTPVPGTAGPTHGNGWALGRGGIWATRGKCEPIKNRAHQIRTAWYILEHVREGAAVWARPELLVKIGERLRARA